MTKPAACLHASVRVSVTTADIAGGRPGQFITHPLLCALSRAFGETEFTVLTDDQCEIALELPGGAKADLPYRAQLFYHVFNYGPSGGHSIKQWAVRNRAGEVLSIRSYAEIVAPFEFLLTL